MLVVTFAVSLDILISSQPRCKKGSIHGIHVHDLNVCLNECWRGVKPPLLSLMYASVLFVLCIVNGDTQYGLNVWAIMQLLICSIQNSHYLLVLAARDVCVWEVPWNLVVQSGMSVQGCHHAQEFLQSDQAQEKAEIKPQESCFSLTTVLSSMHREHPLSLCALECCVG